MLDGSNTSSGQYNSHPYPGNPVLTLDQDPCPWVPSGDRVSGRDGDADQTHGGCAKRAHAGAHNLISSKLTRHITRRELIVREREVEGHHTVTKCDTSDNLADLLTKALDPIPFDKLRRLVLNILAVGAIYPVPRARRLATKAGRNV